MFVLLLCSTFFLLQEISAYNAPVDGVVPIWQGLPPIGHRGRTFGSAKSYFSDFDVDNWNPFKWIQFKRMHRNEFDMKLNGLFQLLDCTISKNDPKHCNNLLEEVRLKFYKKTVPTPISSTASSTSYPNENSKLLDSAIGTTTIINHENPSEYFSTQPSVMSN